MHRLRHGFTLIELVVVIAVIGILASITIIGFGQYQKDTRDARRTSSITVIQEALEKYFDENGEYPSCMNIQAPATDVISTTLKGIDTTVLKAPQAPDNETNSLKCASLSISGSDFFEYSGDGSSECLNGSSCLSYTLRYKDEMSGEIKEVSSRRTANITTSGQPSLTLNSTSFSHASFSFTSVPNTLHYEFQRSTNSSFTSPYTSNVTSSPITATGLSANTQYWFRIRPVSSSGAGIWSNTVALTTLNLSTPTISVNNVSFSTFTASWSAISNTDSYTVQCSSNGTTWGSGCQASTSSTSYQFTGASVGSPYYVRVRAVNTSATGGPYYSNWSNAVSLTTLSLSTPTISVVADSLTTFTASWSAISNANSYTVQCSSNGTTWGSGCQATTSSTSFQFTNASAGTPYYVRVQAVNTSATGGPYYSSWSNTKSVTIPDLSKPVITSTSSTTSSITVNWQAVGNTTSYRLEYATSSNFSGSIKVNGITSTSRTVSGLPAGKLYFVKVYAVNGSVVSNPSDVKQVNTTINAPAAPTMATPTNDDNTTYYTTTWTWSANGSCPSGTSMQYRNQYGYNASSDYPYLSTWSSSSTTTTRQVTTSQGYTYTVYTEARCISSTNSSIYSPWSSTASRSYTQAVTSPTSVSFSFAKDGSKIVRMSATVNGCRSGAYQYGHFVEYSRNLPWNGGPNDGHTGWWNPNGWRITNTTSFSGGSQNSFNIPSGSGYKFKVQAWCRNSATGAQAGGGVYESSMWVW